MNRKRVLSGAVVLAILALMTTGAAAGDKSSSSPEAAIAETFIAAWNSHKAETMLPLFTDDVFYEDVAAGEVNHGKAELRKFAASEWDAVPDLELKLIRASIHDGHGTIEWVFSGTDKAAFNTGKKFSVRGVSVIEVRYGKISRALDFYDMASVMRQVGVLPSPTEVK